MNRFFMPILLMALAVALFAIYTNPAYQGVKSQQNELAGYETALAQSKELLGLRDQLLGKRNALPADGLHKLQLLLPDNVDNIRLIIDINDIAARYHLQVQDISVGGTSGGEAQSGLGGITGGRTAVAVGSVTLSFTVTASYANFIAFLENVEHSLRLVDVSAISFTAAGKDSDSYSMTVVTYWLK